MQVTPYLIFDGKCEEALNFYAKVLGGRIVHLQHFEGSPAEKMSSDKKQVLHAMFEAEGIHLMASDSGDHGSGATGTGRVHLSINVDEPNRIDKLFAALSEGGKVTMPLDDTFWGARFGMLTDKYGIMWMMNHQIGKM